MADGFDVEALDNDWVVFVQWTIVSLMSIGFGSTYSVSAVLEITTTFC